MGRGRLGGRGRVCAAEGGSAQSGDLVLSGGRPSEVRSVVLEIGLEEDGARLEGVLGRKLMGVGGYWD